MKRWNIKTCDILKQKHIAISLKISPIIAQLLINRGIQNPEDAKTFLDSPVSKLHSPFLMKGMPQAIERIKKAIANNEKILIHGDYDVDGITATVLLYFILSECGVKPYYYVPYRQTEGYGLGMNGVQEALRINADLVITVDCGISSCEEVDELNKNNIDVIITDHHEVQDILPKACAVINPLQKDCVYPDKNLSGVSIAFKLCQALCAEIGNKNIWKYADLVSLGTVSDVAPLIGENRILVKKGMSLLNNGSSNKGIKALLEASSLGKRKISSFEIGFILGPRINAAGRIGSADIAIELFLTDNDKRALELAKKLNEANRERQRIESSTLKEAVSKIEHEVNFKEHKVIVLHKEDWHTGVMGIVASRISDIYYRPTILISTKDGLGRGSGRSIQNFHLLEAIMECREFLKEYGGHEYACGITILEENLSKFRKVINEVAHNTLAIEDLTQAIDIDMEIGLSLLDYKAVEDIEKLQPFGKANPEPLFCSKNLKPTQPLRIIKGEHVKIFVTDGVKNFEAIGFGLAKNKDIMGILERYPEFDMAYSVSFNSWQGIDSIQLKIEDIKPSELSLL